MISKKHKNTKINIIYENIYLKKLIIKKIILKAILETNLYILKITLLHNALNITLCFEL